MIELPNGEISRTLPEQVGFNTKKIEEIIKFLNESEIKDLVINLDSPSGILTNAQFATAELSPSYAIYLEDVFYKVGEDSSYIDFLDSGSLTVSSGVLTRSFKRLRIVRADKSYSISETSASAYTKAEIDSLLALKASLSGATFTGPVVAQTLEQNEANEEFNITITTNLQGCEESPTAFKKCKVINGLLYFIVETKLTNNTGAAVSFSNLAFMCDVSDKVGKRIFKDDGFSIYDYVEGQGTLISNDQANRDSTVVALAVRCYGKNKIQPYISSFTINNGASTNVSIRFFYTLV